MSDGQPQIVPERFRDDDAFKNCDFLEIYNGWGRYFKPKKYWHAEIQWDRVLSMGCRVWCLSDDDSMLDFPGIASSPCIRQELRGIGLPNQVSPLFFSNPKPVLVLQFGTAGFGWNQVFLDRDPTGLSSQESVNIGENVTRCCCQYV